MIAKSEVLEKVMMVYFIIIKVGNMTTFQIFFRKIDVDVYYFLFIQLFLRNSPLYDLLEVACVYAVLMSSVIVPTSLHY